MNKDYFLITSYTGGDFADLKKSHLKKFLLQIRKYFSNSFIIIIDGVHTQGVEELSDLYMIKSKNDNDPHGQGDHNQLRLGINLLDFYKPNYFFRFNYDYYINDTVYNKLGEWVKHINNGKKVVTSQWKTNKDQVHFMNNTIAAGFGCYTLEAAKKLFNYEKITYPWEMQLFSKLKINFKEDEYFIYDNVTDAIGEECFDIFNNGGKTYSDNRLKLT
jgi:hypothetical protein